VRKEGERVVYREPRITIGFALDLAAAGGMELGDLFESEGLGARMGGEEAAELFDQVCGDRFVVLPGQGQDEGEVRASRVEAIEPEAPDEALPQEAVNDSDHALREQPIL